MTSVRSASSIHLERPSPQELKTRGVSAWPIWTKEPSTFDWHYDEKETCYLLEGEVVVTTGEGAVTIHAGDWVTFPKGMDCKWEVKRAVRKHYRFG